MREKLRRGNFSQLRSRMPADSPTSRNPRYSGGSDRTEKQKILFGNGRRKRGRYECKDKVNSDSACIDLNLTNLMIQFKPGGNRFPVGRLELGETARNVKSWPSGTVTLGERIIQIQKYKYRNTNTEIQIRK